MFKLKRCVAFLVLLYGGVFNQAAAHDPALHGFNLVTFDKPLAAPPFDLATLEGGNKALSDLRGQFVLVNFWATWCPPCLKEMPSLNRLHNHFADRGFTVVAISSDEEGRPIVQKFIEKIGVDFPILLDSDKAVSKGYGAVNLPVSFLLDQEGQVIAAAQGERDWASDEALSTLDELIAQ